MVSRVCAVTLCVFAAVLSSGCRSGQTGEVNQAVWSAETAAAVPVVPPAAHVPLMAIDWDQADYRLGPGDVVEVTVFEWEVRDKAKTAPFRVSAGGRIAIPLVGDLNVRGVSAQELKAAIERRLRDDGFIREPQVTVEIKEFASKRIAVLGAVNKPGIHTLHRNRTTLLDAIGMAGGLSERAGYVAYVIVPGATNTDNATAAGGKPQPPAPRTLCVDLHAMMEQDDLALNLTLDPGTVVNVPEAGKFAVIGFVERPGSFALTRPVTVLEGIAMAGGLKEGAASPQACRLKRITPQGERLLPLNLVAVTRGDKPNFRLMPGDVIDVRQTTARKVTIEVWDTFKSIFGVGYALH